MDILHILVTTISRQRKRESKKKKSTIIVTVPYIILLILARYRSILQKYLLIYDISAWIDVSFVVVAGCLNLHCNVQNRNVDLRSVLLCQWLFLWFNTVQRWHTLYKLPKELILTLQYFRFPIKTLKAHFNENGVFGVLKCSCSISLTVEDMYRKLMKMDKDKDAWRTLLEIY